MTLDGYRFAIPSHAQVPPAVKRRSQLQKGLVSDATNGRWMSRPRCHYASDHRMAHGLIA